jgi:hypothetical protein
MKAIEKENQEKEKNEREAEFRRRKANSVELDRHAVTVVVDEFVKKNTFQGKTDEEEAHSRSKDRFDSEPKYSKVIDAIASHDTGHTQHSSGMRSSFSFVAEGDIKSRSSVNDRDVRIETHKEVSVTVTSDKHEKTVKVEKSKSKSFKTTRDPSGFTTQEVSEIKGGSFVVETPKKSRKSVGDHYSKTMSTPIAKSSVA